MAVCSLVCYQFTTNQHTLFRNSADSFFALSASCFSLFSRSSCSFNCRSRHSTSTFTIQAIHCNQYHTLDFSSIFVEFISKDVYCEWSTLKKHINANHEFVNNTFQYMVHNSDWIRLDNVSLVFRQTSIILELSSFCLNGQLFKSNWWPLSVQN